MNLQQKVLRAGLDLTTEELAALAIAEGLLREKAEGATSTPSSCLGARKGNREGSDLESHFIKKI